MYRFFCAFLSENNQDLYSKGVLACRLVLLVHLQETVMVPEHVTVPTVDQKNHKGKFSQTDASLHSLSQCEVLLGANNAKIRVQHQS